MVNECIRYLINTKNRIFGILECEQSKKAMTFSQIATTNESLCWARMDKRFEGRANVLAAKEILKMGFGRIDVLEAKASQMFSVIPGIYKLASSNYPAINIQNTSEGFATDGKFANVS